MGKKIVLAVFGGIALFGLALAIVGFALGGRPGNFNVNNDGNITYYADGNGLSVGTVPAWMRNWGWRWRNYHSAEKVSAPTAPSAPAAPAAPSAPAAPAPHHNTAPQQTAPFTAQELRRVNIDISAGYVHVVSGDAFGLSVDGPLEYTSDYANGEWRISAHYNGIDSRSGGRRFWLSGKDITTTFTLTLPHDFDELDVAIDLGEANIDGFALDKLDCEVQSGNIYLRNVTAREAELSVAAGSIDAMDVSVRHCNLKCDAGNVTFSGDITESLDAECSAGSITVTMPTPKDYGWEAEVGLGHISINGRGTAGIAGESQGGNQNAKPYFDLECGVGNIEIFFT